jgi:hypothetical protein
MREQATFPNLFEYSLGDLFAENKQPPNIALALPTLQIGEDASLSPPGSRGSSVLPAGCGVEALS